MASHMYPFSTAPQKRNHLLQNPPSGGIPASENKSISNISARGPLIFERPLKLSSESLPKVFSIISVVENARVFMNECMNMCNNPPINSITELPTAAKIIIMYPACAMLLHASNLLIVFCVRATKFPIVIVIIDSMC